MASPLRTVVIIGGMVGVMGLGFVLFRRTTPSETQELHHSRLSEQAELQDLNAQLMAKIKEAAETNKNVAYGKWSGNK